MVSGQWATSNLAAIVDFAPPKTNAARQDVFNDFIKTKVNHTSDSSTSRAKTATIEDRKKMGKKWLLKWDLPSQLDLARGIIDKEKEVLRQLEIELHNDEGNGATNDLDQYIADVKENVENLLKSLNKH